MSNACRRTMLLLYFLLNTVDADAAEVTFRGLGGLLLVQGCPPSQSMNIVRESRNGQQLLVNSIAWMGTSADSGSVTLHQDLRDRAIFNEYRQPSTLMISQLQAGDDGVYVTECRENATLLTNVRKQLVVCSELDDEYHEIAVLEDGWTEVRCHGSPGSLAGITVRWYYTEGFDNTSLLLDSAVSLDLMLEDLRGKVQVEDGGASLRLSGSMLDVTKNVFCALMEGQKCLVLRNNSIPHRRDVYALAGERVALACASEHNGHSWHTPLGKVKTTSSGQMYVSGDNDSKRGSLVIPVVSDHHAGEYSCFSPALVAKHRITLCHGGEPREERVVDGGDIMLECSLPGAPQWTAVHWYREQVPGEAILIHDGWEEATLPPGQPRSRALVSSDGFSLMLPGLTAEGAGMYWCVIFAVKEDYMDDVDYIGGHLAPCIFKKVFLLTAESNRGRVKARGLTAERDPAPASGGGREHGLAAAVAVLSVVCVGLIATVAVMKKRPRACFKHGERSAETGGANFRQDAGAAGEMLAGGGGAANEI